MPVNVLSVDLGTANTVAVLAEDGRPPRLVEIDGVPTTPSAVFADDTGLVVGRAAEARARQDPSRFEPHPKKRIDEGTVLLGDSIISVTHLLAAILHRVIGEAVRQLDGRVPDELRLTHPDRWDAGRCNVLVSAARLAGLPGEPVLVPESRAAAAHLAGSGAPLRPGQSVAVYDLGAGAFSCAVLGMTDNGVVVLADDALTDLGGLTVDQALLEYLGRSVSHRDPSQWQRLLRPESVEDRIAQRELRENVRLAKEKLATQQLATVPMPHPFDDVDVNRMELEGLIRPSLLRSTEHLQTTITAAGLVPANLRGACLLGGSSRMTLVARLVSEHVDLRPIAVEAPDTAIAFGALDAEPTGTVTAADFHPDPLPAAPPQWPNPAPSTSQRVPPSTSQRVPPSVSQPVPPPSTSQRVPGPPPQFGPPSGGYPNFPPSGGFPPNTGGFAPNFPAGGPMPTNGRLSANPGYPPATSAARPRGKRPLVIGIAVAVVVVLAVVGGIVFFGGSSTASATCQPGNTTDTQGFTPCLRQLAGPVPQHGRCAAGTGGVDIGLGAPGTTTVTCSLGSYQVVYQQGGQSPAPAAIMEVLLPPDPRTLVQADWSGSNLSGHYETSVVGSTGVLVFTVDNSSTLGVLTANTPGITADQLADYFQRNVQPGT